MLSKIKQRMEERKVRKLINEFVNAIDERYGDQTFTIYFYDEFSDLHCIEHTNQHLEYQDEEFKRFVGGLLAEKFFSKGITNVCCGYSWALDRVVNGGKMSNPYVSCIYCEWFRLCDEGIPYCPFDGECDIEEPEVWKSEEKRPRYERKGEAKWKSGKM